MKPVRIHHKIKRELESLDPETRLELAELIDLLASGQSIGMPMSRPMSGIAHGVHELRLKDKKGQLRVFYFTKHKDALLIFHMFRKKTQATPHHELEVARKRLEDLL